MSLLIDDLLRNAAKQRPHAPAILAPHRKPMSYGQLWAHVQHVTGRLHNLGISRSDRVAVVLPNGPEMASCFLATSATAVCAPLNPNYRAKEFEFYLSDLNPKALILAAEANSPAAAVAGSCGIQVIELVPEIDAEAGIFSLDGIRLTDEYPAISREADEVALILHTSGTTSRPKIVPLTQGNLCSSARNIVASLLLTPEDRCLNIMPLFHIHGLVGVLLSSIAAGSSVVCTPGFDSLHFLQWFDEFEPTWYSAVPTMHQSILTRAARNSGIRSPSRLRFIRSCSSALPPKLMAELEKEFQVPVVEAYGMTEASHQMSVNPLPPRAHKAGSVGLPAGCEIAVLDERGESLPAGKVGVVAIRGPNVTYGYENNPEANESAFCQGWFRTGDEGRLDSDGYLYLIGRTEEIINRGGEKISPREVDEALLDHPAVAQAMAFALPDERLGEEIGAAVVLREHIPSMDSKELEAELREFAAGRLAAFKVPRHIIFLKEIPKGPTGKPQRIGMAAKLGLTGTVPAATVDSYVAPRSDLELQIVKIWEKLLGTRSVGVRDDFFKLGGDSLLAVLMMAEIEASSGLRLPESSLFPAATVENLAGAVMRTQRGESRSPIVPIQPRGSRPPFFFLHGQWRGGGLYCSDLSRFLGTEQPFFAIVPHGLDGVRAPLTIQAMAAGRVRDVLEVCPAGPIRLGGYCNGALVAFEMARQIQDLGREVDLLVIVETHAPNIPFRRIWRYVHLGSALLSLDYNTQAEWFLRLRAFQDAWRASRRSGTGAAAAFLLRKLANVATRIVKLAKPSSGVSSLPWVGSRDGAADPFGAISSYVPSHYKGPAVLLRTKDIGSRTANFSSPDDPAAGWAEVAPQVQVCWIPGTHETIVREQLAGLARQLRQCLEDADSFRARSVPSLDGAMPYAKTV